MINIDYLTIRAFLRENNNFFSGARIQKIRQSTPRDLIITLRNNGESRKLYINISPDIYHICFMSENGEKQRHLTYPKNPPMFCMLLRKYLDNAKIVEVKQPYYERIIEFVLEAKTDFDANKKYVLAVELMGKHSNIILYDKETFVIAGCAHNVGENKSQIRELFGGLPYVYPPVSNKKDFLRYFGKINHDTLFDEFLGFSKYFAQQCRNLELEEIKDCIELKNINPAITESYYSIFGQYINGDKIFKDTVNEVLDEYYSKIQFNKKINTLKSGLRELAVSKLKKIKTSLSKIESIRKRRDNTEKYKLYGELLTAYAYTNNNYVTSVILKDYNTGDDITIPLDENLSMIDNAKRYFKLYTKSKRTREKTENLIYSLSSSKEYWEGVIYSIDNADTFEILDGIKEELQPEVYTKQKQTQQSPEQLDINDYVVYLGRNNRQNDFIISKLAKDDDIWFHIKGHAGSHVLLKINTQKEPEEKVIFECAKLAKKYSSVPENEKAGVIYTRRKYLRKPPGANPGYVTYRNEKEIYI